MAIFKTLMKILLFFLLPAIQLEPYLLEYPALTRSDKGLEIYFSI